MNIHEYLEYLEYFFDILAKEQEIKVDWQEMLMVREIGLERRSGRGR
jgi:hypothetical protein